MTPDLVVSPGLVLNTWAAGIAAGAAAVALWKVGGRGFLWLAAGVVTLVGAGAALASGSGAAWAGVVAGASVALLARWPSPTAVAFALSGVLFAGVAASEGGVLAALTGAIALGGVTDEMLLGHWYLVDPRLPRRPLRRLAVIGIAGLALDAGLMAALGAFSSEDPLFTWAFAIAAPVSVLLMVGVLFSLREPSYPGVMAATGLSYLALLTSLTAVTLGRVAVGGLPGAG